MAALIQVVYNHVVGGNVMAFTLRLKIFDMDGVAVTVVSKHDVLILTTRVDG